MKYENMKNIKRLITTERKKHLREQSLQGSSFLHEPATVLSSNRFTYHHDFLLSSTFHNAKRNGETREQILQNDKSIPWKLVSLVVPLILQPLILQPSCDISYTVVHQLPMPPLWCLAGCCSQCCNWDMLTDCELNLSLYFTLYYNAREQVQIGHLIR